MTIVKPDDEELILGECAECGNDTFHTFVINVSHDAVRIKRIKCAICGDTTDFVSAPPEVFN